LYITVEQVRKEGGVAGNTRLTDAIMLAQQYIELMTSQWFEKRTKTLKLDGTGQTIISLPIFCISISSITEDGSAIESGDYYLYNRFFPDDRKNPRIKFEKSLAIGNLNIEVSGDFGYVEEDESTPVQIQKVCTKLALAEIGKITDQDRRDIINRNRITRETTDGHSYELGSLINSFGYTADPEIDDVLIKYKRPIIARGI